MKEGCNTKEVHPGLGPSLRRMRKLGPVLAVERSIAENPAGAWVP